MDSSSQGRPTNKKRAKFQFRLCLPTDGIDLDRQPHLQFDAKVHTIIRVAEKKKRVVLSGPPVTGKTALLTLLTKVLEARGDQVWRKEMLINENPAELMTTLRHHLGVVNDRDAMKRAFRGRKLWLLIDDGHNAYDTPGLGDFWRLLFQFLRQFHMDEGGGVYVVLACSYDATVGDDDSAVFLSPQCPPYSTPPVPGRGRGLVSSPDGDVAGWEHLAHFSG